MSRYSPEVSDRSARPLAFIAAVTREVERTAEAKAMVHLIC
jgi:hypothetical protein